MNAIARALRKPRRSDTKQLQRDRQKAYVMEVLESTGVSKTALGKAIGAGDGTIAQFLDDDRHHGTLDGGLLQALVDWSGIPFPAIEPQGRPRAMRANASPYLPKSFEADDAFISKCIAENALSLAFKATQDLPAAYVRAGDIVIIDQLEHPKEGDLVVCIFSDGPNEAFVFRIFSDPFLLPASKPEAMERPELRDAQTRRVMGVVTKVLRTR